MAIASLGSSDSNLQFSIFSIQFRNPQSSILNSPIGRLITPGGRFVTNRLVVFFHFIRFVQFAFLRGTNRERP